MNFYIKAAIIIALISLIILTIKKIRINLEKKLADVFPYSFSPIKILYKDINIKNENSNLAKIFQPIWEKICLTDEAINSHLEKNNNVGRNLFLLAKSHIRDKNKYVEICSGTLIAPENSSKQLEQLSTPMVYKLSVIACSEPAVSLKISYLNIELELHCQTWNKAYRPSFFSDCSFSLWGSKYKDDQRSGPAIELVCVDHTEISYKGPAINGHRVTEGKFYFVTGYDKFGHSLYKDHFEIDNPTPIFRKIDEFLSVFGLKVERYS